MQEYEIDELAEQPWEETLDVLTADMDPSSIDIAVLAERYREYIDELQEFDLEVPARAIRLLAALLRIKTFALSGEEIEEEEQPENPMDFEEDELVEEAVEDDGPDLEVPPELEMPVKPRPRRRMEKSELKDALRDAMQVKQKREERQRKREELDRQMDLDEKSLEDKINSLFSRLTSMISGGSRDKVEFEQLLEEKNSEEKIEKFLQVLHLENEERVRCIQEEFLGDLEVKLEDEIPN
ncbi:MAG: segregation/condensation protein A [Candidatus Nanohaloarchaea archaeon]